LVSKVTYNGSKVNLKALDSCYVCTSGGDLQKQIINSHRRVCTFIQNEINANIASKIDDFGVSECSRQVRVDGLQLVSGCSEFKNFAVLVKVAEDHSGEILKFIIYG
jgi:hypothetical protein